MVDALYNPRVHESRTTQAVQRFLDQLTDVRGDSPAEPIVRALLSRAVDRLHQLCATMLYRSYPRLTKGPLNLESQELLGAVVERLLKAMRNVRPETVRQFFALVNQHMKWELNDLARRLDQTSRAVELRDSAVAAPQDSNPSVASANTLQILQAIEDLPEEEREAFNLVRIQGLNQSEAADVIGVSSKTVQRRLTRGLLHLKEKLSGMVPPPILPPVDL
jgi:RNA polymerase sigma factor (sigma-70 family)